MSNWEFDGRYECDGSCYWGMCGGHDITLEVQDTSDTFTYSSDNVNFGGFIEELVELKKLIEKAEENGLI
jgi:hypothetical protein